jgi:pyruvate carboxylase
MRGAGIHTGSAGKTWGPGISNDAAGNKRNFGLPSATGKGTPGEKLAEDAPIVILESMKMEIPVPAPLDCTVLEILVKEGDSVTEGDPVAHIES